MRAKSVGSKERLIKAGRGGRRFLALLTLVAVLTFPAVAQPIRMVSVADPAQGPAAGGGGDSMAPILSADGAYVLFTSAANNLALTTSNTPFSTAYPPRLNAFVREPTRTALVSVNLAGTGGGNGDSIATDLSADGRYALFESSASDLVAGDTNNCGDVFWRDLDTDTTRLVSAGRNGAAANGASRESVMTADGRYVAFVSEANNLVPDDTNGIADVFVADLLSNTVSLVSVGAMSTNAAAASGGSSAPDITPDGRYVVFCSTATNLVPGVRLGGDIYLRDLLAETTYWVSEYARTQLRVVMGISNTTDAVLCNPMISDDGRYVVYRASPGVSSSKMTSGLILRYSLETASSEVLYANANVVPACAADEARSLDMTPDGRFVAFVANTNGSTSGTTCICVCDALTGRITLASGDQANQVPRDSICGWPSIDPTGRYVAFMSPLTNQYGSPVFVTNTLRTGIPHLRERPVRGPHQIGECSH